jgi:hypothetical protein
VPFILIVPCICASIKFNVNGIYIFCHAKILSYKRSKMKFSSVIAIPVDIHYVYR